MRLAVLFATVGVLLVGASARAATPQADVIVVVDTSGSMDDEVVAFEASINSFASAISGAHVDLHVVLIGGGTGGAICLPAPLGSGLCPADQHLPGFRHVQEEIGSTDGLEMILSTYPQWAGSLRDVARKFIIILTDDESDLSAASFSTQLHALSPAFAGYSFNALAVAAPGGCGAAIGTVYAQLVAQTGGILSNLCTEPIAIGLDRIAAAVREGAGPPDNDSLLCNFELNGTSFVNGNTVTAQVYRFANLTAAAVPIELKIWLVAPGAASVPVLRAGADSSIVLPAGYDHDSGPRALLTIKPQYPRGSYGYNCRLLDPVTGRVLAEDLNSFVVQ